MRGTSTPPDEDATTPGRRRYDSPVRRQRAAETRERILAAATELVHGFPTWDWKELTFRAVADRAGVSERTVFRHFPNERELHEALLRHLAEEAGVSYDGLELDDVAAVAARVFASLSSYAVSPLALGEGPFATVDQQRRDAVLRGVEPTTADWPDAERMQAAAMLDVLWSVPSFERLVTQWNLSTEDATSAITWVIGLVVDAIREGRMPRTPR